VGRHLLGARTHGSQLVTGEDATIPANSRLSKYRWSARFETDRNHHHQNDWCEHNEGNKGGH
jgi:hypothetical protein